MPFRPSAHWPTNCKSLIYNTGMAILLMDRTKHFNYLQYTWLAVGWKQYLLRNVKNGFSLSQKQRKGYIQ